MLYEEFVHSLKEDKIERVYLITGDEDWLKKNAIDILRKKVLEPGLEALNELVIEDATEQQIIDAAETMPMMSAHRLVIVTDWPPLIKASAGQSGGKKKDAEGASFDNWLANSPESCVLVFYLKNMPERENAALKNLKKLAAVVDCSYLDPEQINSWANKQLKASGKTITKAAVNKLIEMVGQELSRLTTELAKLTDYTGERKSISVEDVEAIVSPTVEFQIFRVLDELLDYNVGNAQRIVNRLLETGTASFAIRAAITTTIRRQMHLRLGVEAGGNVDDIGQKVGFKAKSYAIKINYRQSRKRTPEALKWMYEECVRTDFAVKTGELPEQDALPMMLLKFGTKQVANRV